MEWVAEYRCMPTRQRKRGLLGPSFSGSPLPQIYVYSRSAEIRYLRPVTLAGRSVPATSHAMLSNRLHSHRSKILRDLRASRVSLAFYSRMSSP